MARFRNPRYALEGLERRLSPGGLAAPAAYASDPPPCEPCPTPAPPNPTPTEPPVPTVPA